MITDDDVDSIENYFYDLPAAMNRHVAPVGNGGGVRASLLSLHQKAGLNTLPTMFINPGRSISNSSQISRPRRCSF